MPSSSPSQARLMAAIASGKVKKEGISQEKAKEWMAEDMKRGLLKPKSKGGGKGRSKGKK